jgi:hypothetical protein
MRYNLPPVNYSQVKSGRRLQKQAPALSLALVRLAPLARVHLQVRPCYKKPANQSRGYRNYICYRRLS